MNDLKEWFQERNGWIRSAVNILQEEEELTEDNFKKLVELCIKEANEELDKDDIDDVDISFNSTSSDKIELKSLKNIQGINALAPNKPLRFGDKDLSIIYGQNGSGKSGYVRILKHICGARQAGELLPNVFKSNHLEQKCDVDYKLNDSDKTINWKKEDGKIKELSTVDIYDTSSGEIYVDEENEVTYEPPLLKLFSDLVEIAGFLSDKIDDRINQEVSKKPVILTHLEETQLGEWYVELAHDETEESVQKLTNWTDENQERLKELKNRLNTESPADKARKFKEKKKRLDNLIIYAIEHIKELSNINLERIVALDKQATEKEEIAKTAARKVFSSAPL